MVKIGHIQLPEKPLLMAPMEDISDPPFRIICRQMGADMVYSEFISSEGLIRQADKSKIKLDIFPEERPVAIQVFGHDEKSMMEAAEIIDLANPDIIDINFGCPVKKIVRKGAGAAALQNILWMVNITKQIVGSTKKPVSVKTRLGWDNNSIQIVELCEMLQDVGVAAIALHGRTAVQQYSGNADWTWFKKIKENKRIIIPLFGNGDVKTPVDAKTLFDEFCVDGVMIGRAAIGNPWIFKNIRHFLKTGEFADPPSVAERAFICKNHLLESVKWKGERQAILEMRPHYSQYFKGINHFKPVRIQLVSATELSSIIQIIEKVEADSI